VSEEVIDFLWHVLGLWFLWNNCFDYAFCWWALLPLCELLCFVCTVCVCHL